MGPWYKTVYHALLETSSLTRKPSFEVVIGRTKQRTRPEQPVTDPEQAAIAPEVVNDAVEAIATERVSLRLSPIPVSHKISNRSSVPCARRTGQMQSVEYTGAHSHMPWRQSVGL